MKQDLATKEIEQRLKQEIEKQRLNELLCNTRPVSEAGENAMNSGNCNTLKIGDGKTIWHKNLGKNNVNNHSMRSRSNKKPE